MRRAIVTALLLSFTALACGGDDDADAPDADADEQTDEADATASDDSAAEQDAGDEDAGGEDAGGLGQSGGITFEISGAVDASGEWAFIAPASSYSDFWTMTSPIRRHRMRCSRCRLPPTTTPSPSPAAE